MNNIAINIPTQVFVWMYIFSPPKYMSRSGIAGSCGDSVFNFFRELREYFPKKLCQFALSPAVYESCELPHPHKPTLAGRLFHSGHSRRGEVGSHCRFHLHLSDD